MKLRIVSITLMSCLLVSGALFSQDKTVKPEKRAQMMEMMTDSTMMHMMVQRMAGDEGMRIVMMRELITAAKADSSRMQSMCWMMLNDPDMHGAMKEMMDGGIMQGKGVLKDGGMLKARPQEGDGKMDFRPLER